MKKHLADPNNPYQPLEFPATWASEWGQDEIGLWMGFTYKGVSYRFRWILPGEFLMGDEAWSFTKPVHPVHISQGFWLGETTVTQALWQAVMDENPSVYKEDQLPVNSVSWDDTKRFIQAFNALDEDLRLCLPTEAQWEFACRAGTQTQFFFGDELKEDHAHFDKASGTGPVQVKEKPCNAWGLYQMHGNVWEWCEDRYYGDYYQKSEKTDPGGPSDPSFSSRVLRGGSWNGHAAGARSAYRYYYAPDVRYYFTGFRLARG